MRRLGYLTVVDAIRLLQAGLPVYIVSAPVDTQALPLDGAWQDDDGRVHYDCSCICLSVEKALEIGRMFNQQCILRLYPSHSANGSVYLLKDSPLARQVSLEYAGGYTADGDWLFTAVDNNRSVPFQESYEEWVPADIEFIPVK